MEEVLYRIYVRLLDAVNLEYKRYLYHEINWNDRLIGITGPRGTGKTTMILQRIKESFLDRRQAIYVSLDNIWFTKHSISDLVEQFHAFGGTHLFLDEVHRYPNWSIEIKNIYDSFPSLHIVFTGSSILEIYKSNADLSRRAITYHLHGLSFREFLNFESGEEIGVISLEEILNDHMNIVSGIISKTKILPEFKKYLEFGYYPFYKEGINPYGQRLQNIVNTILDNDLPSVENIEYPTILKIKKMLMIISSLVPFSPNIASLSAEIETNRASAIKFLGFLQKAGLIRLLLSPHGGMSLMNKPEKIYLDNTNLIHALATSTINEGNARETFFVNQCAVNHKITSAKSADFVIDDRYTIEVGGKGKSFDQIKNTDFSYIAMDGIESGYGNKIPLWLFGFMY
jgi:predicted AAA+ superfamily ATPase